MQLFIREGLTQSIKYQCENFVRIEVFRKFIQAHLPISTNIYQVGRFYKLSYPIYQHLPISTILAGFIYDMHCSD